MDSVASLHLEMTRPELQLYSMDLVVQTQFQGLAYFMRHWWATSAIFFVSLIVLIQIILLSSTWKAISACFTTPVLAQATESKDSTMTEHFPGLLPDSPIPETVSLRPLSRNSSRF